MPEDIHISFQWTREELLHAKNPVRMKSDMVIKLALMELPFILIAIYLIFKGNFALGMAFVGIGALFVTVPLLAQSLARGKKGAADAALDGTNDVTIAHSGITYKSPSGDGHVTWGSTKAVYETGVIYLFEFRARRKFYAMPRRAFETPEQEKEFRALMKRKRLLK